MIGNIFAIQSLLAGVFFNELTQHRAQRLVFLSQAFLQLLTVEISLLANLPELTDLVYACCSLRYQRSRVLGKLLARGA